MAAVRLAVMVDTSSGSVSWLLGTHLSDTRLEPRTTSIRAMELKVPLCHQGLGLGTVPLTVDLLVAGTSVLPLLFVLLVVLVVVLLLAHQRGEFLLFDGAHFGGIRIFIGHESSAGFKPAEQIRLLSQGENRCRILASVARQGRIDAVQGIRVDQIAHAYQDPGQSFTINHVLLMALAESDPDDFGVGSFTRSQPWSSSLG